MFDILDIKCKVDEYTGNDYVDRENTWNGQIVIDQSGYFEGLVISPYSGVQIERFVFGVYKDNRITLYKFEPTDKGVRTRYDGWFYDASEFLGNFSVSINDEPLFMGGICFEISQSVKKEFVEDASSDIMFRTETFKKTFFDSDVNDLYNQLALSVIQEKDNENTYEKK